MLLRNGAKGLLLFSSLIVTSVAFASPTVSDDNTNFVAPAVPAGATVGILGSEINQISELYNTHLATVAAEFLKPPATTDPLASSVPAKPLPPLPAAFFLSLSGFICVSFVKDRKVWITVLAGLLWLSHTGLSTLPKFASQIISKKQIQRYAAGEQKLAYIPELDGSFRPRSDLEGTEFIGLLRRLAGIPDTFRYIQRRAYTLNAKHYTNKAAQFAIIKLLPEITLPTNCLVFTAEQHIIFSPSFIFVCLARSPPQPV